MRSRMVKEQLEARGIHDENVLSAMAKVPRHLFVPPDIEESAYTDRALPIGEQQTISQPYIVAFMTQAAHLGPKDRVLEIGTGSGYQTAVLAQIAADVFSVELLPSLAASARERLDHLGYRNVHTKIGDGYRGWKEKAPFDAILVTAAAEHVPEALLEQLRPWGKLVIPVGHPGSAQQLQVITKHQDGEAHARSVLPVAFVPLVPDKARQKP